MKKTMNPAAVSIIRRFVAVLNYALDSRLIDGVTPWCEKHGLNRTKYNAIRASYSGDGDGLNYKGIDVDALAAVCVDFNVNPEWLLLGLGPMLRPAPSLLKPRKSRKTNGDKMDSEVLCIQT